MNLFHSTKKDTQKNVQVTVDIIQELGHTPMTDWVAVLILGILAIVGIATFTTVHYVRVSAFIKGLPDQSSNTDAAQIKTKEERLQDVLEIYTKKQKDHLKLLGVTKSIVAKEDVSAASASTTKTTSGTTSVESSASTLPSTSVSVPAQ